MTKAATLQKFFSQFLTAYESNGVYGMDEPPVMPYLTYTITTGAFNPNANGTILPVNLWYRSEDPKQINAKVEEISQVIGRHGVRLKCDGGYIVIRRNDTAFAQSMGDPSDDRIKRRCINLTIEYFTND